jgi:hypothetical protein
VLSDWQCHGLQAIREVRESRPADYLRIIALLVSRGGFSESMADEFRDEAVERFIAERRRAAVAMIAAMRDEETPVVGNGKAHEDG